MASAFGRYQCFIKASSFFQIGIRTFQFGRALLLVFSMLNQLSSDMLHNFCYCYGALYELAVIVLG